MTTATPPITSCSFIFCSITAMGQLLSATTVIFMAILAITIIINSIGIFLLVRTRGTYTNQKLILTHLSICQILLALSRVIYRVMDYYEIPVENKYKQAALVFLYIELSTYYLMVINLTVDRFIACKYPLRYAIILARKKMKMFLAIAWLLGIAMNLPQLFFSSSITVYIFNYATLPVLDFAFIVTAAIGYGYILRKVRKAKHDKLFRQSRASTQRKQSGKFFKMAAVINLRFFLLIIIPDIVFAIYFTGSFGSNNILRVILIICWYTNPIFDPITYIFMQKGIRSDFRKLFQRRRDKGLKSRGQLETFTTNSVKSESIRVYDTRL